MFSIHDQAALSQVLPDNGLRPILLRRLFRAIYKEMHPSLAAIAEAAGLPEPAASRLVQECRLHSLTIRELQRSANGETTRFLLATTDGLLLESVIMRHVSGRNTLCLSCQVGCPMACSFCATGQLGLVRDLDAWEIIDQVDLARRHLSGEGRELRNLVFMGMGEPFLNYAAVSQAISLLTDQSKYQFAHKKITVSTCGIPEGIAAFGRDHPLASLAISLHAPDDATRRLIMPAARATPIAELMASIDAYMLHTGRKVFFEYIMIQDLTDRDWQADALAQLLEGRLAQVNFIPWNPGIADGTTSSSRPASPGYAPSEPATIARFQARLRLSGIPSTIRVTMGDDIAAACGQLAGSRQGPPGGP